LMLTTDHEVVRIPHHDHFPAGVALAPMLHPCTPMHSFADTHSFAVRSNKPPRTEVISNEQ
jgi:hypothetical protein